MINKVTLVGNVGRDPELRRLESGVAVAQFSIATNESYKDRDGNWQDSTEWHEIVVWRALADRVEAQLKKGMLIYLEGKLTTRKWQDKDGNPRKTTEVVGSYLRILNKREEASANAGSSYQAPDPSSSSSPASTSAQTTSDSSDVSPDDDDLPF